MRPKSRSTGRRCALAILFTLGGGGFASGQEDPEVLNPGLAQTKRTSSKSATTASIYPTAPGTQVTPATTPLPMRGYPASAGTMAAIETTPSISTEAVSAAPKRPRYKPAYSRVNNPGKTFSRSDSAVKRTQAAAGEVPQPPSANPTGSVPVPVGETINPSVAPPASAGPDAPSMSAAAAAPEPALPDLGVPAADRGTGGGEPTEAEAADEKPEATLLMKFLGMEESPVKIYGWIENSFTGNADGRPASGSNFGVNPNNRANQWMGNQYYLIVENPLEQNDEVNFGFRVDNLFGNDWQFNYMQGFANRAFPNNYFAGYDMAQAYGEVHLPILTEGGVDIKGGRWYTIAGYEQVPAIARPLLSVPYMFNYGQPFTHFGAITTWHATKKINIYNGAINGWDRWINQNYKWGYIGGFTWTSEDDKTSIAMTALCGPQQFPRMLPGNQPIYPTGYVNVPSVAGQVNPGYGANTRTLFTTVLTRKWTDKLTQVMETDQGWEKNVPGLGANPVGSSGAVRDEQWYSFGNWFLYSFNEKITGVWRSEWFRDHGGARTGYSDNFYEMTLGLIYKPVDYIWIRPEARYDWAQFTHPYADGTRNSQLTLAFDIILLF